MNAPTFEYVLLPSIEPFTMYCGRSATNSAGLRSQADQRGARRSAANAAFRSDMGTSTAGMNLGRRREHSDAVRSAQTLGGARRAPLNHRRTGTLNSRPAA